MRASCALVTPTALAQHAAGLAPQLVLEHIGPANLVGRELAHAHAEARETSPRT